jgi:hypothetical protein
MKIINYKFDLDDRVTTPFGEDAIITMLGFDEGGAKYYVQSKDSNAWFKENQLTAK